MSSSLNFLISHHKVGIMLTVSKNMRNTKKLAELNNNKLFIRPHIHKKMVLELSNYDEGSVSRMQKKYIIFRKWIQISCLQAAAVCGDNYLVKQLLSYIASDDALRKAAAQQLEIVLQSRFYLAPFKELIKAYDVYMEEKKLGKTFLETYPAWTALSRAQQSLPAYGLQEFFMRRPFDPLPTFNEEPERACYFWSYNRLEFDSFTDLINSSLGLCKLKMHSSTAGMCATTDSLDIQEILEHKIFIQKLCEVRHIELQKLIRSLLVPSEELGNNASINNKFKRLKVNT